ncbi:MAG: phosphate acetyltransferase [Desulfarculus sp.]|jgi:acyl dehydratase|nr:MAG: phosphate acetyltransferase [Desulfarculus sp.]
MNSNAFEAVQVGDKIMGEPLTVTAEQVKDFAEASHDYNALHLDDSFMESTKFGKTQFEGVIAHGLFNYSRITKMLTDWLWPQGAVHRRLETRHLKPVYPGDTITAVATVASKHQTPKGRWIQLKIELKNQRDEVVVSGESMAEYPS